MIEWACVCGAKPLPATVLLSEVIRKCAKKYNFFADIKQFYYLCKIKIYIVGAHETY